MTYISDDEIAGLPEEPEQRFVGLEAIVRSRYEEAFELLANNESSAPLMRRYMSIVLPAAKYYGIEALSNWAQPPPDAEWDLYNAFFADVDFCITTLRLRNIEQVSAHSVALDADTKTKLRQMLEHVRQTVQMLDISVAKKEAFFKHLNNFQAELDRGRTRWQAFAALMIEACDDVGKAAEKLEPVVRILERVGAALGVAKRAENAQPRLPPPKETRKIEPPVPKHKSNGFKKIDDEIPF